MLTPKDLWQALSEDLSYRESKGLFRSPLESQALGPTRILRGGKQLLHFSSNDYLGMAWHPQVREEYQEIAGQNGVGSGASPLILGASAPYFRLVRTLAQWHGCESAVVFPSGYAANLGTITALAGPEDLILSDALNHACLIDACRLSKATVKIYPHRDVEALGRLLASSRKQFRMAFVITDTVFSMDGDIAPIEQIDSLCREFDAIGIADEAHAGGVIGKHGTGVLDQAQVDRSHWIKTGTLSKAIGCVGGYVTGSNVLCQTLHHRSRSFIYSTALPPALLAAASRSIEIIQHMDLQRHRLVELSSYLRRELEQAGYRTASDTTPIVPIYVRDPHEALDLSARLLKEGIYVPAIRPPTVPPEGCLLRVSLNAAHTIDDCQKLLQIL
ncbi:MAG: aminotransferase class I/II-fold pyridoxal phosphate-dependent enzyme [Planctomycetota bacterium]